MRVTVLGGSAASPNPGQGCAGYLLETGAERVVVDLGPDTLATLRAVTDFRAVDAILISHLHSDHVLDLVPYRYGLRYAPGRTERRVPLWMPPGGAELLRRLAGVFAVGDEKADRFFTDVFEIAEFDPDRPLRLGRLTVSFHPTQHFIPCWAFRFEANDRAVAYLADTGPVPGLADFARDVDLLICEATYLEPPATSEQRTPGHLSAGQAGQIAAEAGARRLLLTHYWAELGADAYRQAAAERYRGPIDVARPRLTVEV